MYKPPLSSLPFIAEEMSIYGPKAHQRIISMLNSGLGPLYYREHSILLEPLPETMLNEGEASPVPDLILYDNQTQTTPIIIEVCHSEGRRKDLKKVISLIDADEYGIQEGFVYNYFTKEWYRYHQGGGGLTESSSLSLLLNLDLNQFIVV